MGEGWSDWYAKDFLVAQFPALDNPAVNGDVHMGTYTDATPNPIRREGLDCPVNCGGRLRRGSRTATSAVFGTEVHDDGEIWAQTLWDLRQAIGSAERRTADHAGHAALAAGALVPG